MVARRLIAVSAMMVCLGMSTAQAGPMVGGRLGVTVGGSGEFDSGRGVDNDHQDMGGTSYDAFLLIPIADVMRVGTVLQLTPNRSVRVEEQAPIPGVPNDPSAPGARGGRWDFGKILAMNAVVEYEVFTAPKHDYEMHVTAGGGLLVCVPRYEVERLLELEEDDGVKLGYNFGLGLGAVRIMEGNVGLRADFTVTYEALALVNTDAAEMQFNSLRYLLSLGVVVNL